MLKMKTILDDKNRPVQLWRKANVLQSEQAVKSI